MELALSIGQISGEWSLEEMEWERCMAVSVDGNVVVICGSGVVVLSGDGVGGK